MQGALPARYCMTPRCGAWCAQGSRRNPAGTEQKKDLRSIANPSSRLLRQKFCLKNILPPLTYIRQSFTYTWRSLTCRRQLASHMLLFLTIVLLPRFRTRLSSFRARQFISHKLLFLTIDLLPRFRTRQFTSHMLLSRSGTRFFLNSGSFFAKMIVFNTFHRPQAHQKQKSPRLLEGLFLYSVLSCVYCLTSSVF